MSAIILKDVKRFKWIILITVLILIGTAFLEFSMYNSTLKEFKAMLQDPKNLSPQQIESLKKDVELIKNFGHYLFSSWYMGMNSIIMVILSILLGVEAFGSEYKKTSDFLFTRPISYGKILISKFIAGLIAIMMGTVVPLVAIPMISAISGKEIDTSPFIYAFVPYIIGFLSLFTITVFISILTRFKRWISALISLGIFIFWTGLKDIFGETMKALDFNTLFLNKESYVAHNIGGYSPFVVGISLMIILVLSITMLDKKDLV